ncbi:MAG: class I SAM-dependent methyltransferase [Planctomycetota bacterium]
MAESPPESLKQLWLPAVLLPGETAARASCLRELAEYTGKSPDAVLRLCQVAVEEQRRNWYDKDRRRAEDLIEFYNSCEAYIYELLWWHALEQGEAPAWNARLLLLARAHGARRYLDFGGGVGTNGILLAREGLDVTVADVSDVLQRFARWRFERRGLHANFVDLKTTSLEPARYDLVSAVDVLEHVADPIVTLRTLHETLAPGGLLVFDLIASKADSDRPFHLLRSKYPIRASVRGLGFEFVEKFQKYVVYRKVARSAAQSALVRRWDTLRWRLYYLAHGQWPAAQSAIAKT